MSQKKTKETPVELTAEQIMELADRLTPEERLRLEAAGVVIPQGVDGTGTDKAAVWGYHCPHCNELSLLFVGTKFGVDGSSDKPLAGTRIHDLAFIQTRRGEGGKGHVQVPPEQVNRWSPQCHYCGAGVPLGVNKTILPDRVVNADQHRAQIDEAFSYQSKLAVRQKINQLSGEIGDVSQDYNLNQSASDLMSDQAQVDAAYVAQQAAAMAESGHDMGAM